MQDDTFIFLDEFLDTELYIFLNKSKEKILKFILFMIIIYKIYY